MACGGNGLNDEIPNALSTVYVGYSSNIADRGSNDMRPVTVDVDSVTFGNAKYSTYDDNACVIPYKIYGGYSTAN